ncbi:hypothetical protein LTR05_008142 [Lithohypha guttulata]|uniref:Nucleotide-diphospho-sugar transferase n=1 Tax=Lithohypha guttulata TaxID=1690604 RepID=A0AAN7Y3W5_9EURO|nr:hypothetical protein LTR05_008142 [Lithohypha guttulata]
MSKLRAWELTDYSRLLMLDGDMLLRRPIDNVFDELNATIIDSRSIPEKEVKHDENPIPAKYLLAGGPEVRGTLHHFPPSRENGDFIHPTGCNLGFVMLAPSREMFEYYMSILKIEGRFNSATMEQSLLNYAHRPEGAMPWQDLPFTYNTRTPIEEDIVGNVASIHEKWWTGSKNYPPLRKWYRSKEEMEKFYIARDATNT